MNQNKKLKNVALLATSHNVAKAYISRLNALGHEPNKVILFKKVISRKARIVKTAKAIRNHRPKEFFQKCVRKLRGIKNVSESKIPNFLLNEINTFLSKEVFFSCDFRKSTDTLLKEVGWDYDEIQVTSINAPELIAFLKQDVKEKFIIFSGGGILRSPILSIGKKFIHVHPGVVPEVKGADCLLWSALVYNEIGMSSFFMNKGIDTGDIIKTSTYSVPKFELQTNKYSLKMMKHVLINFVDPHYRAEHLINTFMMDNNPDNWKTTRQNPVEGKRYFFMHDSILPKAINKFIKPEDKS